jgi:hypothetical protein
MIKVMVVMPKAAVVVGLNNDDDDFSTIAKKIAAYFLQLAVDFACKVLCSFSSDCIAATICNVISPFLLFLALLPCHHYYYYDDHYDHHDHQK